MSRSKPVVLMLLPATDYDPTESAVIWDGLTTAGIEVQFATPSGEPVEAEVTEVLAAKRDFEQGPRFTVLRDSPGNLSRGFTVRTATTFRPDGQETVTGSPPSTSTWLSDTVSVATVHGIGRPGSARVPTRPTSQ